MNIDRHLTAHWDMFKHLVRGDGDSAEKHREFYDEYLAVMDLTAEFYLQTLQTVFVEHRLPKGEMMHRDKPVDLMSIRRCAIMAVEGENDDISGVGQTCAALELTPNLPPHKKVYHLQKEVGHYGVFNGSRFRREVAPRIGPSSRSGPQSLRGRLAWPRACASCEPRVLPDGRSRFRRTAPWTLSSLCQASPYRTAAANGCADSALAAGQIGRMRPALFRRVPADPPIST